jgi:hypothetical protein
MHPKLIARIRRVMEEGPPHLGAETEGIVTDTQTLEVVHEIGDQQPTQAIKSWIRAQGEGGETAADSITPDVPETTVEANPAPLRSPTSTAAAQRLLAILQDTALLHLNAEHGLSTQLLHGAAWRPPRITAADASRAATPFKRLYYDFQIGVHGDKVGAAAGDHFNLSAPWLGGQSPVEISRIMVEMTGRMRLIGGPLSIALSAASPLYFGASYRGTGANKRDPIYGTSLTPWESARLGEVWPGRTIMDVSGMSQGPVRFRKTLRRFARTGTLLSGRDVWLMARAQPGPFAAGPGFEDLCGELGLDLDTPTGFEEARRLLHACFQFGPDNAENPLTGDPAWVGMEAWRQDMLERVIRAPRNRVEIRTLETPPAFAADSPGGDYRTPYEWIRSVHAFLEVLFVYLADPPRFLEDLEFREFELQAAKSNEQAVLRDGLDAQVRWIPGGMDTMTARELLRRLLEKMGPLIDGLGRRDDLALVQQAADGAVQTPATRMRQEVGRWYGIDTANRENARLLPDDSYALELLRRTRESMSLELDQIESDLSGVPALDRPQLAELLSLVRRTRSFPSTPLAPLS